MSEPLIICHDGDAREYAQKYPTHRIVSVSTDVVAVDVLANEFVTVTVPVDHELTVEGAVLPASKDGGIR